MLAEFLSNHREAILANCRAKVSSRGAPRPSLAEVETGVPLFLDQLIDTLRLERASGNAYTDPAAGPRATEHGRALQELGFTAAQVIHDYGDVCQAITEQAMEFEEAINVGEFHTLNRVLDDAMADAVTEFGRQRERSLANDETERLGFFAHELRNLLANCMLAFDVLKSGKVGIGGSTGLVLGRNLTRVRDLIDRSLAEVRMKAGLTTRERVRLAEFIEEVEVAAMIEAKARRLQLTVTAAPPGAWIEVDRQILAAAVANLLQNAFKYTRPHSHVTVETRADGERATISVEDECGGLDVKPEQLFAPFEQRSKDRSGLGLGLAIAREGARVNGGEIRARNVAGRGCVFTVSVPLVPREGTGPPVTTASG